MGSRSLLRCLRCFCCPSDAVAGGAAFENRATDISWDTATAKAQALVKKMTLEEMNAILYTVSAKNTSCILTNGVPRLGFRGFCLNDGPGGPRAVDFVNAYASGLSVAASWNTALAYDRGLYMGEEFKNKGGQVAFSPVVAPLGRTATGGRNWEGFGADPYLAGKLGAETVQGLQKNVIATIKHFVGYEQETGRSPTGSPTSYSSNIGNQTLREIYMWPFQDTIRAGVASVMCSYNRLNSTYSCESPYVMQDLLKNELGFPGYVISDQDAQHVGIPAAAAGLDMTLGGASYWNHDKVAKAVQNGKLSRARLENMATRILASWYKVIGGPNSTAPAPGFGYPPNLLEPHHAVDGRNPASKPTILQSAVEGHVLVKNVNNALPLKKPVMLSIYGYDASVYQVNTPDVGSLGKWAFGIQELNITATQYLLAIIGEMFNNPPQSGVLGTAITGGGSGSGTPSFVSDPYSAILQQAQVDDTYLEWDFQSLQPSINGATSACIVFVNDVAAEGYDRGGLADPNSDTLIKNVAANCKNTIVILHNHGIRVVDAWINNENVTGVVYAHTPGQVSGQALVSILYGQSSPSGRLPYTVPKKATDFGSLLSPCPLTPKQNPQCVFSEGELIDYRRFLAMNIEPRFAFGYGLTYTNFSYSDIAAKFTTQKAPANPPQPNSIGPGGIKSLFDPLATVTAKIANTGSVSGSEVAQLYVQFPNEPKLRFLRGFVKQPLAAGQSATVTFTLTRRDLSRWSTSAKTWQLQSGAYTFHVGPNVEDVPLKTQLTR